MRNPLSSSVLPMYDLWKSYQNPVYKMSNDLIADPVNESEAITTSKIIANSII